MMKREKLDIWNRNGGNTMTKKSGLGKGLDALFGPVPEEEKQQETDTFKKLKITEIEPNKDI